MDRRNFLKTAGAAAAAPLLPVPAMAGAKAAAVGPVSQFQVGFAALYARVNAGASPDLIRKWLRVDEGQASYVMEQLVQRGILESPIAGSAAAVQPMYPSGNAPGVFRGTYKGGKDVLKRVAKALEDEDHDPAVVESDADPEVEAETDEQA